MKSEQTPIRTRLSRIEGKRTTQATSLQLGFSGTLRFNITAEESLWDQRFCMIFRGECERDLSGGRGRCKGLSSWATNGPAKWLFRCSGVSMSGCSSTSKITPWRWLFMIYYDLYTMRSSFLIHTVLNLHFLSKNSTLISLKNFRFFGGEKLAKKLWFGAF